MIIALLAVLASCGADVEKQRRLSREQRKALLRADSAALKIATTPTMDCLPLFVGVADSCFKQAGVDVHLRQCNAQIDGDTLIANGYVEGVVSDLVRTERLRRMGTPLLYVAATNASWQLVANRTARVKSVAQLAEKMIAMTRFSATDYLADLAVREAKPKGDVFRIQVNDVQTRLRMLLNNEMDAMLLPEPQATTARLWKNTVLLDTKSKDIRLGVIAFSEKAMKDADRKRQLSLFIKVYNQMCDSINKNGVRHYAPVISKYMGADEKTINALPNMKYPHASAPRQADLERAK
ncbi:ABC transporter substrate-binding protein [Hallella sp.]|uniref:ABC transporter substrate-binding protein n=1 Tax=Hallella sp. TaxID=2980186 RepID=UPI003078CE25